MTTTPRTGTKRVHRVILHPKHISALQQEARKRVSPGLARNDHSGWEKVRAEGRCRMCQREWKVRPPTRHHLVPQAWFRQRKVGIRILMNANANIVPLCRPCHDLVEDYPTVRRELRRCLGSAEVAFVLQMIGRNWFEREYPRSLGNET